MTETVKAHIFEPYTGGHHTQYIAALIPALQVLLEAGHLSEIVVTISRNHLRSRDFAELLDRFGSIITIDARNELIPFQRFSAVRIATMLLDALQRVRPDFLILTSANYAALPIAMLQIVGLRFGKVGQQSVGIFHHRTLAPEPTPKQRAINWMHRFSRKYSPWTQIFLVNPLLFDALQPSLKNRDLSRLKLLPDPSSRMIHTSKSECRQRLNIPTSGWYIGHVGGIDARFALPELLAAFRSANLPADQRLLLAGSIDQRYRKLIDDEYADLMSARRLIVIDRFLTGEELDIVYAAIDVAALTYYKNDYLSAKAIDAIVAHRPLLGSREGHIGLLIDRFRAGWSCDVREPGQLTSAISSAAAQSCNYSLSPESRRLIDFASPDNYASTLLSALYQKIGLGAPQVKTWDWVLDGSDEVYPPGKGRNRCRCSSE
jgi:hypothetical protein